MTPLLAALLLLASTWTEAWTDTAAWQPITQTCFAAQGGSVSAVCQSGALRTLRTWDPARPLSLSAQHVCGQPAPGSSTARYWAGVALYQDEAHYAELATEREVPPYQNWPGPQIVAIDPAGHWLEAGTVGGCHDFRVDYDSTAKGGRKGWTYSVDGVPMLRVRGGFTAPLRVELLCVSLGEATPDDGSAAACSFGAVSVTQ